MSSPVRPTLRQEQQAATRQRLIDAARAAFLDLGYADTTVERIADSANTSRATFYLHFRSKTDVLLATWGEREWPEVDAMFARYDAAGDFGLRATVVWIHEVLEYWERHGAIALTGVQIQASHPQFAEVWTANMLRTIEDMPRWQAAVGQRAGRATALIKVLQLERTLFFWTNGGLPVDRELLVETLAREWALTD